jgi:hypothetical protein
VPSCSGGASTPITALVIVDLSTSVPDETEEGESLELLDSVPPTESVTLDTSAFVVVVVTAKVEDVEDVVEIEEDAEVSAVVAAVVVVAGVPVVVVVSNDVVRPKLEKVVNFVVVGDVVIVVNDTVVVNSHQLPSWEN